MSLDCISGADRESMPFEKVVGYLKKKKERKRKKRAEKSGVYRPSKGAVLIRKTVCVSYCAGCTVGWLSMYHRASSTEHSHLLSEGDTETGRICQ